LGLIRDSAAYESLDLEEDEREALRIEVTKKWSHPFKLYMTVAVCSIGAAVQGWDQTGSNGANLSFPVAFGIPEGSTLEDGSPNTNAERNLWLVGVINAAPYMYVFAFRYDVELGANEGCPHQWICLHRLLVI